MPIINEFPSTGVGWMPEMFCPEGPMMQAGGLPAVVNMGGNAVTGFAIRYTTIDELARQSGVLNEMPLAGFPFPQGFGGAWGGSRTNMRMNP